MFDRLRVDLRPGAEKLGITLADVSRQVRQAYYGEEVQRLPRANGDVKVMVKYPLEQRRNLSSLDNFRVRTADGREVPLLSVVEVELANGAQRIQRRDGKRYIRVRADVDHDLMGDITKDVAEEITITDAPETSEASEDSDASAPEAGKKKEKKSKKKKKKKGKKKDKKGKKKK